MKTNNPLPQALIGFRVYLSGEDLLGVADVELPELEAITEEVKGAGIAGKIDAPILGHYDAMSMTINWRAIIGNISILAQPKAHQLDMRGSVQLYDAGEGVYQTQAVQCVVKAVPKKISLGKLSTGEAMDTKGEFAALNLKLKIADDVRIEIDPLNYVCKIEDTDYLEQVKADLGL